MKKCVPNQMICTPKGIFQLKNLLEICWIFQDPLRSSIPRKSRRRLEDNEDMAWPLTKGLHSQGKVEEMSGILVIQGPQSKEGELDTCQRITKRYQGKRRG